MYPRGANTGSTCELHEKTKLTHHHTSRHSPRPVVIVVDPVHDKQYNGRRHSQGAAELLPRDAFIAAEPCTIHRAYAGTEGDFIAINGQTEQPPRRGRSTEQISELMLIIEELKHSSSGGTSSSSATGIERMVAARSSPTMPERKREILSKTTKKVQAIDNELDVLMVRCEEHDVTCGTWPLRGLIRDRTDRATQPSEVVMCTVDCLPRIHISEPTRLRRISYAVFCVKKKNI